MHHLPLTLSFTQATQLPAFPEAQLTAFLLTLLDRRTGDANNKEANNTAWWVRVARGSKLRFLPGDTWTFALWFLPAAQADVDVLLQRLAAWSGATTGQGQLFGANVRLALACSVADAQAINMAQCIAQAGLLDASVLRWRWDSPVRLRRAGSGQFSGEARFVRDERDFTAALFWQRALGAVQDAAPDLRPSDVLEPSWKIAAQEQFWLDQRYGESANPVGGLLGEVLLQLDSKLTVPQAQLLVLAGTLGLGQRRGFGLGAGSMVNALGSSDAHFAGVSVLPELRDPARWQAAFSHCAKPRSYHARLDAEHAVPASDGDQADHFARLAPLLTGPGFHAPPLCEIQIAKPHSAELRRLMIAPFWDRVAQRVVLDAIAPLIEACASQASFGFRVGRSRQQARDQLLALYRQGYTVALESDVAHFFDEIDPWRIRVRLQALLGFDPLIERVLAWISAPLKLGDGTQRMRPRGLPQGSPLSPALANLLLSDFDSDLISAGFQLVRFADDFVVACKNTAEANAALLLAANSLAEKGLQLKASKTRITSFAQGFDFLGYRFVHGTALEVKDRLQQLAAVDVLPQVTLDLDGILADLNAPISNVEIAAPPPAEAAASADAAGQYLVLAGEAHKLSRAQGQWLVAQGSVETRVPGEKLSAIVLVGLQHITTGALTYAMDIGTPVHFIGSTGKYRGALWPEGLGVDAQLWRAQDAWFALDANTLAYCKELISARIAQQREVLRQRDYDMAHDDFAPLLRALVATRDVAQARGIEGRAAAFYFAALQHLVPKAFGFYGRERRPPTDPFNALLSLGYTVLQSVVNTGCTCWVYVQPPPACTLPTGSARRCRWTSWNRCAF